jgi:hypothetical protein
MLEKDQSTPLRWGSADDVNHAQGAHALHPTFDDILGKAGKYKERLRAGKTKLLRTIKDKILLGARA